jgi:outer membrane protein OmpA-like peptidoglycan-associated protein
VPIQPAGAPALKPDPILADSHNGSNSGPLVCASAKQGGPTSFRLPADVLFDFDKATLSPAAQVALDSLAKQINGTAGAVSVAGNTDAIGSDAYNQTLSEQRAAAVADALKQKLGGDFTFASAGNGKTKPVAPNTNPDGSDNPDGRAQNRRVDIEVTTTNPAPSTSIDPASNAVPSNVTASVQSVRRVGGFLLTTLRVSNPGPTPAPFAYNNTATADSIKGGLFPGEVTVLDPAGASRTSLCVPGGIPNTYFSYAASMNAYNSVPPGGSLTLWGITPAPAADAATVNVRIGGFAQPFPTQVTPNS